MRRSGAFLSRASTVWQARSALEQAIPWAGVRQGHSRNRLPSLKNPAQARALLCDMVVYCWLLALPRARRWRLTSLSLSRCACICRTVARKVSFNTAAWFGSLCLGRVLLVACESSLSPRPCARPLRRFQPSLHALPRQEPYPSPTVPVPEIAVVQWSSVRLRVTSAN